MTIALKIELLIATMFQEDYFLLDKMNVQSDAVVVNQCYKDSIEIFYYHGHKIKWINTTERGLSNSRNMAIKNSDADICLICDDDECLKTNYRKTIEEAYQIIPEADIIAFNYEKAGTLRYKKLINIENTKIKKSHYFKTYNSIRLSFKRKSIVDNNIYFDARFGAGSNKISCGEETVWQRQAQIKKLKRYSYPKNIAILHQGKSTWFSGLHEKYYYDIGACLGINYGGLAYLLMFYYIFFIRGSNLSGIQQMHWMMKGILMFKRYGLSYEEYVKNGKN